MLGINWNELYFDNMPIGCNLDELIWEQEEKNIIDIDYIINSQYI